MEVNLQDSDYIKVANGYHLFPIMANILKRENFIDRDKEHFWVVGLASNLKILFIELIALGTKKSVPVEPMEVFSVAIQKRAVSIVLVHNHPSLELTPSEADFNITDQLIQTGRIVNIPVYDHLIITPDSYYSFLDTGQMERLEESQKYVAGFKKLQEAKELGGKESKAQTILEIAKEMKRNRVDNEIISLSTGLSLEEIKGLKVRLNK